MTVAQAFIKTEISRIQLLSIANWASQQPIGEDVNLASIDALLDAEWIARVSKYGETPKLPKSVVRAPPYTYNAVPRLAPKIAVRSDGNAVVRAAVEANEKEDHVGTTVYWAASRSANGGLLGRVWGGLHL